MWLATKRSLFAQSSNAKLWQREIWSSLWPFQNCILLVQVSMLPSGPLASKYRMLTLQQHTRDLRTSAKHWFESSYQEKAGVGEKRHRVPRFCSRHLTLFPLAQLKILTYRTAQRVWGYGELRAFWEDRGQQRQAEKATLIGSPQQAKLVSHMEFKSPVAAHMLQAWKCIYLHKRFALGCFQCRGSIKWSPS